MVMIQKIHEPKESHTYCPGNYFARPHRLLFSTDRIFSGIRGSVQSTMGKGFPRKAGIAKQAVESIKEGCEFHVALLSPGFSGLPFPVEMPSVDYNL
jgi:hypothetical protein